MEKDIKLYYGLDLVYINKINDNYLFYGDGYYYQYVKCLKNKKEIDFIINICKDLNNKKVKVNEIIYNKKNECITNNYILIKINYFLEDLMNLKDLLYYSNIIDVKMIKINDTIDLWKKRVDYLEKRISMKKYSKLIMTSFNYYVGVAENAINLLENINYKYESNTIIVLSRNKINYPLYFKDYFNPLEFIFDSRVRDITNYLKSKFYKGKKDIKDVELIINENYTIYEYNLFFLRMIFPSYYFDELESFFNNKNNEKTLLKIINKKEDYIEFLQQIYNILSKYTALETVKWIIKKQ